MKHIDRNARLHSVILLILTSLIAPVIAQEVSILDPGLEAAVRDALQIPRDRLTEQDLLSLTVLEARDRNVRSVEGLEAAGNLVALDLQSNLLTSFSLPSDLTNLETLDLSHNSLTNCSLTSGFTNLAKLLLGANRLTNLTLPADLTGLVNLDLSENQLTSFNLPPNLASLGILDVGANSLTNFSLPSGLTNLTSLTLAGNLLTNLTLPGDLTGLAELDLASRRIRGGCLGAALKCPVPRGPLPLRSPAWH